VTEPQEPGIGLDFVRRVHAFVRLLAHYA